MTDYRILKMAKQFKITLRRLEYCQNINQRCFRFYDLTHLAINWHLVKKNVIALRFGSVYSMLLELKKY